MKTIFLLMLTPLLIVACATRTPSAIPPYKISKPFDVEQAKQDMQKGTNTIKGSALIRQQGGGVVTCAGQEVKAIPATRYADERMWAIYAGYGQGYRPTQLPNVQFENDSFEYHQLSLKTTCDAQGFFKFENVADASFYVVTVITWGGANSPQGGALMKKTNVWKGETKEIVLTP